MKGKSFFILIVIQIFILFVSFSIIGLSGCKKKTNENIYKVKEKAGKQTLPEISQKEPPKKIEGFEIRTFPKNNGYIRRKSQPLYISFSQPIKMSDFSFEVYPEVRGWDIEWKRRGKTAILRHSQPFKEGETYNLVLSVQSYNIEKEIKFTVYGPSSLELIDKDEKENLIDLDTAWTYRLQALFEPSRVPPKYRSSTPMVCGTGIMRDFKKIESSLKKETLQRLKPYLVPPTHPESIFSQEPDYELQENAGFSLFPELFAQSRGRTNWGNPLKCDSAPIKIWYKKGNEEVARKARDYIDSEDIYNRFLQLMGKEPPSDGGEKNNGGDENLDIYLVSLGDDGQCIPYRSTKVTPSYILVNKSLAGGKLLATLAHELFHAFQFAYDLFEDEWWLEGSAVWAEDYINQQHNDEQQYLPEAFFPEENRLETITDNSGYHPYGIYLFPFYLSKYYEEGVVGTVWKACGALDAITAVENEVQDLKELLKDFAYKSLDLGPTEASYPDSGGPLRIYELHWAKEKILNSDKKDYEIEVSLPPLSAVYLDVYNRCDPEKTPHIEFDLGGIKAFKQLTVQAIIDPYGDAKEEDWTGRDKRSFCINREDEKFEEIVIVVSSSDKTLPVMTHINVDVDAEGCVEADATLDWTIEFNKKKNHKDEFGFENTSSNVRVTSRAQLKLHETYVDDVEISEHYDVISWDILSVTGTIQGESEHHPYPPPECPESTRCETNGSVIRWEKEDEDVFLTIEYDKKSGRVKSVILSSSPAMIYWEGQTVCKHVECSHTWTTVDPFVPNWEYFTLLDWSAFKEIAQKASGNIKSETITGGGSYIFPPGEPPGSSQTLKANYTIKIRRKKGD